MKDAYALADKEGNWEFESIRETESEVIEDYVCGKEWSAYHYALQGYHVIKLSIMEGTNA